MKNRWLTIYLSLVERGQRRTKSPKDGNETHHIVPKSFWKISSDSGWIEGDPDNIDNLTVLTPREHLLAHRLLIRFTSGLAKAKMFDALWQMVNLPESTRMINGREYESLRKRHSEAQTDRLKILWQDPEYRENQSRVQSVAQREVFQRPGQKERHRQLTIEAMAKPEVRAKIAAGVTTTSLEMWARPGFKEARSKATTGIKNSNADQTVYVWTNVNGETEVLTRVAMTSKYGKSFDKLFCRNPKQQVFGWQVATT